MRLVARTNIKEAMTAAALLVVVTVSLVMQKAGLSASLGAFIAGALLAESSYRHQLEADIQPFQGPPAGLVLHGHRHVVQYRTPCSISRYWSSVSLWPWSP